jgi:uncharacterized protein with NAD-binding domain and iron-sulfur cluster
MFLLDLEDARPILSGAALFGLETSLRLAWAICKSRLDNSDIRHAWIWLYVVVTNLRGIIRDRVLQVGTDALDALDYRDWLKSHELFEVPPHVGSESAPVLALYDLAFSRRTGLAAGVTLRAVLRMLLDYAGHFAYKMNGGMGEIVFSPLFVALRHRGVQFRFFHEVSKLHVRQDAGGPVVSAIDFQMPKSAHTYTSPVSPVTGKDGIALLGWPAETPTLASEPHITKTLKRGADDGFDVAVLGISIGGLTDAIIGDLRKANQAFDDMIRHQTTVGTQAAQVWMSVTARELGWPCRRHAMLISYARPFNAWVDMSHLIGKEGGSDDGPASVHYLCDELHDGEGKTAEDIRKNLEGWLHTSAPRIWPKFTYEKIYDPRNGQGKDRLKSQYFRANLTGSDRYVTVGPGSPRYRLAPADSGFRNLAMAGDWVFTELCSGCLEAAAEGGLGAGRAIIDGKVK